MKSKHKPEKSNLIVRVLSWLYLQFSTEGGGTGAVATVILIVALAICFGLYQIRTNPLQFTICFVAVLIFFGVILIYFMSLSKDKIGQKIFLPPIQRYLAYRYEQKILEGTDKTGLKESPKSTPLGQPQFASNERNAEITGALEGEVVK